MDISKTIEPRSDQQNYEDYITGDKIVTITAVTKGTPEQPVNIQLAEYPTRPYKPSKSMRRIICAAWGTNSEKYVGQKLQLHGNPDIMFGKEKVGGIQIVAMSGINQPITLALTVRRGKRQPYTVQPLNEQPVKQTTLEDINNCTTTTQLRQLWAQTPDNLRDEITRRAKELEEQEQTK